MRSQEQAELDSIEPFDSQEDTVRFPVADAARDWEADATVVEQDYDAPTVHDGVRPSIFFDLGFYAASHANPETPRMPRAWEEDDIDFAEGTSPDDPWPYTIVESEVDPPSTVVIVLLGAIAVLTVFWIAILLSSS